MRILGAAASLTLVGASAAQADVLITPREAKLPDAVAHERGVTSGPRVLIVSPARGAVGVVSPFTLQIRFEPRDGSPVDLGSLLVTYEKSPPVDLTERIRPYLTPNGINMPAAEAPVGKHYLHVEVKDTQGRIGGAEFAIDTEP